MTIPRFLAVDNLTHVEPHTEYHGQPSAGPSLVVLTLQGCVLVFLGAVFHSSWNSRSTEEIHRQINHVVCLHSLFCQRHGRWIIEYGRANL